MSLAAGTHVTLDCGTIGRSAVVRWQAAGALGLAFDRKLDAREAAALIERSRALAERMNPRD